VRINVSRSRVTHIVSLEIFNPLKDLIVQRRSAQHRWRRAKQYRRPGLQNADGAIPLDLYFDWWFLSAKTGNT